MHRFIKNKAFYFPFYPFQLVNGGNIVQPILIAAGGGGSSSRLGGMGHSMPPDGRGLINPWDNLNEWRKLVSKEDIDAGNLLYY